MTKIDLGPAEDQLKLIKIDLDAQRTRRQGATGVGGMEGRCWWIAVLGYYVLVLLLLLPFLLLLPASTNTTTIAIQKVVYIPKVMQKDIEPYLSTDVTLATLWSRLCEVRQEINQFTWWSNNLENKNRFHYVLIYSLLITCIYFYILLIRIAIFYLQKENTCKWFPKMKLFDETILVHICIIIISKNKKYSI